VRADGEWQIEGSSVDYVSTIDGVGSSS
jgi:hypothetical protein